MPRKKSIPAYRRHSGGQARVTINGRDYLLGPYGSPESKNKYARLLAEWSGSDSPSVYGLQRKLTVAEMQLAYLEYAKGYYGTGPSSDYHRLRPAMRPLRQLYAELEAERFGPERSRRGRVRQTANLRRFLRRGGGKATRHVASNRLGAKETYSDNRVFCVRFTPDGKSIVAGSRSGLRAYDANGSGTLPLFQLQIGVVKRWRFSPDGSTLITVGNQIYAWDTASGSRRYTLEGQGSKVLELAFNAGGDRLFAGLNDGRILCWNVLTGNLLEDVVGHEQRISQFRFTPDNKYLLTSGADKTVAYWAVSPLKELSRWKFDEVPGAAAFTRDNKAMAFAFSNGEIQILDAASGELRCKIQGHGGDPFAFATREVTRAGVSSMAFSEDGSRLATFGLDETLKLWDATSGENVLDVPANDLLGGKIVEFSQNRILLASSRKWIELSANDPAAQQESPSPSTGGESQ